MKTTLNRFKVYNFRSIEESDWIEVSDNSCLIGTNEAGKTNLLIALWKLNPANKEPIVTIDDFPRHLYSKYKADNHSEDVFIAADFQRSEPLPVEISKELKCDMEQVSTVLVKRKYDGNYFISFPYSKVESYPVERLKSLINDFEDYLFGSEAFSKESKDLQESIKAFLNKAKEDFQKEIFRKPQITDLKKSIEDYIQNNFGKKKNLPDIFQNR